MQHFLGGSLCAGAAAGVFLVFSAAYAEEREIEINEPFSAVHAARGANVILSMSETPSARADVDDPDYERLEVFVEDDTLHVRRRGLSDVDEGFDLDVFIEASTLKKLKASTGAALDAENVTLLPEAEIIADTGGEVVASGTCTDLFAKAATGGIVDARKLECQVVKAKARTGGEIDVFASERAEGYARLGGSVDVYGGGRLEKDGTFLGGTVRKRD